MAEASRATWVIGGGGLIGSAIRRQSPRAFEPSPVRWTNSDAALATLEADLLRFGGWAADSDWCIVWAAGASVVASTPAQTEAEGLVLRGFLEALRRHVPPGRGAFFYTSSAGGVYAGSWPAPFDESTVPITLSPYGEGKLRSERAVVSALVGTVPVVLGRFSNVYGPGQNLAKAQGLVTKLCLSAATRRPINVFVPMETVRDYIFVDDAARSANEAIREAIASVEEMPMVRVFASGRPVTIGTLLKTAQQATRHRVAIVRGSSPSSKHQVLDLRMRSTRGGIPYPAMTLEEGVAVVYRDVLRLVMS